MPTELLGHQIYNKWTAGYFFWPRDENIITEIQGEVMNLD